MYAWRSRCRQTYGRHPWSVSIEAMEYQVTGATTATSSTAACLSLCLSSLAFRVSPVSPRLPGWVAGGGGGQMMPRQGSLVVCFLFSCKQHPLLQSCHSLFSLLPRESPCIPPACFAAQLARPGRSLGLIDANSSTFPPLFCRVSTSFRLVKAALNAPLCHTSITTALDDLEGRTFLGTRIPVPSHTRNL